MSLFGRNPTPSHYYHVVVCNEQGVRIDSANLPSLPPIGYRWRGREIIAGEIIGAQMDDAGTSTNLAKAKIYVR